MESVNPATGESIETYESDEDRIDEVLDRATDASVEWADEPLRERRTTLVRAAAVLRENADEYAELITSEMGKPIEASRSEVEKCAWVCEYYAETAAEHLQDEMLAGEPGTTTYVRHEPLGVVLAIMPWNFPLWQAFRFAAPNVAAGNVGVLKHASNVPGCARAIETVFAEAGVPEGVFSSLLVGSDAVEDLIEDDRIAAVTLTGSEAAGRAVGSTAGGALKKSVLELGGSDPFVVLADAPMDETLDSAVSSRCLNTGQSCISAKRFVVLDEVYDEFLDGLVARMDELRVGDPMDPNVDLGPMAREDLRDDLHEQVEASVDAGATLELGGEPLDREGNFYPPTVLADVPRDCPAADEETFGPVAAVFRVEDEEEAIDLANDTRYGLGASVWTSDLDRGERLASHLDAGLAFVNEIVQSDPRLPFGGVKASGYGRELAGLGIREFVNEKTVWVSEAGEEDVEAVE